MTSEQTQDWHDMPGACGFAALIGPIQRLAVGANWLYRLRIAPQHTNNAGIMHGGAMMALLDETVGTTVRDATGRRNVTIQMNINFLRQGRLGEHVVATATISRLTRALAFVEARLAVEEETIATASLVFKAIEAR